MVKFGHYLASNRVPEWAEKYVRYKPLKKQLKRLVAAAEAEREAAGAASSDPEDQATPRKVALVDPERPESDEAKRRLYLLGLAADGGGDAAARAQPDGGADGKRDVSFHELVPRAVAGYVEELKFFSMLEKDLDTVNGFFAEQELYFLGITNELVGQANRLSDKPRTRRRQRAALKRAARELYRGLELMKNYRILNYTAFVKILKKHDKNSQFSDASIACMPAVTSGHFHVSPMTETLRSKTEEMFIEQFGNGSRSKGMEALRGRERPAVGAVMFRLGVYVGLIVSLVTVLLFMARIVPSINTNSYFVAPFPMYRALALVNVHLWAWGFDLLAFRRYRVNHLFILEANTRNAARPQQVLEVAAGMTVFLLAALNLYLLAWAQGPDETEPAVDNVGWVNVVCFLVSAVALVWPFKQLLRPTRVFFLRAVGTILVAPFAVVDFKGFFIADQLTSQVRLLVDLVYSTCFFATGSFVDNETETCNDVIFAAQFVVPFLPYWWRLAQCLRRYSDTGDAFPHLVNAGKYFAAITVTFWSLMLRWRGDEYEPYYIAAAVVAMVYAYAWDIKMDWGLLERGCASGGLRRKMVVPTRWVYYGAAVVNLVLRAAWVLTISPQSIGLDFNSELVLLLVGSLEVVRRGQWNFFRVENEHLNNVGKFRAVNVVPVMVDDDDDDGGAGGADEEEEEEEEEERSSRGAGGRKRASADSKGGTQLVELAEAAPHFSGTSLRLAAASVADGGAGSNGSASSLGSVRRRRLERGASMPTLIREQSGEASDHGSMAAREERGVSDGGDDDDDDDHHNSDNGDNEEEVSDYEAYAEREVDADGGKTPRGKTAPRTRGAR